MTRRPTMAKFLLSVHTVEGQSRGPMSEEEMREFGGRVGALEEEMRSSGTFVLGGKLDDPSGAVVVRAPEGKLLKTDGPFAESKEQLGGFYIIEADDHEAALGWASKVTRAISAPIELRAIVAES
jgi:hypothetical protein